MQLAARNCTATSCLSVKTGESFCCASRTLAGGGREHLAASLPLTVSFSSPPPPSTHRFTPADEACCGKICCDRRWRKCHDAPVNPHCVIDLPPWMRAVCIIVPSLLIILLLGTVVLIAFRCTKRPREDYARLN